MSNHKFQFVMENILAARDELRGHIWRTPLVPAERDNLWFKAECLQRTGSFKVRAAFMQLLRLAAADRSRGVVTSSSGNFGQALACAANSLDISAKVVMMQASNPLKVERTREWGAEVVFCENRFEARLDKVRQIEQEEGRTQVYPYDHPFAVAGNGTISLEILEELPEVEQIVVPISGGGLIAGVTLAAKMQRPDIRVIGVQPEGSNATYLSFREGRPVSIPDAHSIADGLLVAKPGDFTFSIMREYLDAVETVREASILEACRYFLSRRRLVVEPSGAVPMAALLEGKLPEARTVLVLSGGNIRPDLLAELV